MEPDEKLVLTMKEMQRIEILRRVETRRLTVEAGERRRRGSRPRRCRRDSAPKSIQLAALVSAMTTAVDRFANYGPMFNPLTPRRFVANVGI